MNYRVFCPQDTQALGGALGSHLQAGDTVLLTGDLGAGKSVLVRAAARSLGVEGNMPSPTFTLMQPYPCRDGGTLCHYDLYRLEDEEEFYAVGLDEPLGRDICLVEWPMEYVEIPLPRVNICIRRQAGDDERLIQLTLEGFGPRESAILSALEQWEEKP